MRLAVTLIAFVLVLFTVGCDGFTHIQGKVIDASGKPIQGAVVEMKTTSGARDDKSSTESDGSFSVGFTHAPFNVDLVLTVSKEGYKTFVRNFKSADEKQFASTIILQTQHAAQSK